MLNLCLGPMSVLWCLSAVIIPVLHLDNKSDDKEDDDDDKVMHNLSNHITSDDPRDLQGHFSYWKPILGQYLKQYSTYCIQKH